MDNLFKTRALTSAYNAIRPAGQLIFQTIFAPYMRYEPTDRFAFDIITGSETILKNLSKYDPALMKTKTSRATVTLEAPRIAEKFIIHAADLTAMRAYGDQTATMMLRQRLATEMLDQRNKFDRTLEFWAAGALKGIMYDSDASTELLNFGLDSDHSVDLSSTNVWSDTTNSDPVANIRTWKQLVEDDSGHQVDRWVAFCGYTTMNYLINHPKVGGRMVYQEGVRLVETGRVMQVAGVDIMEYNASYLNSSGTRTRFVAANSFVLVGIGAGISELVYTFPVDFVHENAKALFHAKSWENEDPSGIWVKAECRCAPVMKRPDAVVVAIVD